MKFRKVYLSLILVLTLAIIGCSNSTDTQQSAEKVSSNVTSSSNQEVAQKDEEVAEEAVPTFSNSSTEDINWDTASTAKVKEAITAGIDINKQDDKGRTPLMKAAKANNVGAVKALLNNQADANIQDNQGKTALIEAASEGNNFITELLLDYKADVNLEDNSGNKALDYLEHSMSASKLSADEVEVYSRLKKLSK
ncbi:ankyrin repeat protein [Orenia metallireducens]|jgi:ankyrin repeat protein|uniref:Ankyrin repeat-containing protein n=1 Tax=Orenia metallireducens TaxID=1413210 RepID=A0A285HQR6_9FIRM|nr:ankyrin repeat domain-containing protein [Orenia metallireducens]PRX25083.1 ankyrin repeat protein [Orenia metallireducens]SNY38014.1 Ankyrin repeat-containing protein [Orenia metallireducens]